jgi:hypothetical protein
MSFGMFFSTYLLAFLPLTVQFKSKTLQTVSIVGAGLLVGAAFTVIMPEGILVLISALSNG